MRNTKDEWFIYEESDLKLVENIDFNFQSDQDDSKNISDCIFTLKWRSDILKNSKQHTITNSVCEAEYIAASDTAKEI